MLLAASLLVRLQFAYANDNLGPRGVDGQETAGLKAAGIDWHHTEIEDLFDELDTDHSGWISTQELKTKLADSVEGLVDSPQNSPTLKSNQQGLPPSPMSQPIDERKQQAKQRARALAPRASHIVALVPFEADLQPPPSDTEPQMTDLAI